MQLDGSSIYITGIILKRLISFLHILFNYIWQNRIFSSHRLILPFYRYEMANKYRYNLVKLHIGRQIEHAYKLEVPLRKGVDAL